MVMPCIGYGLVKMDMMLEFCNRGIKNYDLFESTDAHEASIGNDVDKVMRRIDYFIL